MLVVNDRVRETTATTGTGTITLAGAVTGYQSFAVIGNANTCYYTISDQLGVNWEVGIGTYTLSGTTLARTTVLKSSNANALVNFTAGTKDVFVTYPAETAVSGGGGGTYPTIQPTLNLDFANTRQLDPRITFVRNSTATYYDGQTTAKAEQNLLLQSNMGVSPWFALSSLSPVVTANAATAPDGTTTATSLLFSSQFQNRIQTVSAAIGLTYTFSFYAQNITGNTALTIYYDNGLFSVITTTASWARYSIIFVASMVNPSFGIQDRNSSGFGTTLVWGAQLEQRSSVTAYTPTTTSAITNYIPVLLSAPAGVPRFDCDPITRNSLGLLIEESRVNLLTYSSDFSNAIWGKTNSTSTSAATIAPDGTQTANLFIDNTTNGGHIASQATTTTVQSYTASIYIKTYQLSKIMIYNYVNGQGIGFDASTGATFTVTGITSPASSSYSITSISNGWYRCTLTYTGAISSALSFGYYLISGTTFSYAGTGQGIFIWGAQLEAGSFATSLIPTVASTVTRAADTASMTGTNFSSWYNQAQGGFCSYTDFLYPAIAPFYSAGGITTFALSSTIHVGKLNTYDAQRSTVTVYANTLTSSAMSYINSGTDPKIGNLNLAVNGIFDIGDSTALTYLLFNATVLTLGSGVGYYLNGHIRKISYYPQALSSANLVALTS